MMTKQKEQVQGFELPEVGTPEREAFENRLEAFKRDTYSFILDAVDKLSKASAEAFMPVLALATLAALGGSLLKDITASEEDQVEAWGKLWRDPWAFPVRWNPEEMKVEYFPELQDLPKEFLQALIDGRDPRDTEKWGDWSMGLMPVDVFSSTIFSVFTGNVVKYRDHDGGVKYFLEKEEDGKKLDSLDEDQQEVFIFKKTMPFCLSGTTEIDEDGAFFFKVFLKDKEGLDEKTRECLPFLPQIPLVEKNEHYIAFPLIALWPLEVDCMEQDAPASFPISAAFVFIPDTEAASVVVRVDEEANIQVYLSEEDMLEGKPPINKNPFKEGWTKDEDLVRTIFKILIVDAPAENLNNFPWERKEEVQEGVRKAVQEVRASYFPEYLVPRAAHKNIKAMSSRRGLGRLFKNVSKVPDLSLKGDRALQEAISLFWAHLETYLDKEAPGKWEKIEQKDGSFIISLHGYQIPQAETLWEAAVRSMAAEQKGPGLKVAPPQFKMENHFDSIELKTVVQTDLILWPKGGLTKDGETTPPVSFYQPSSPGYVALLERQGGLPFFCDGWVCFTVGALRERYKVHYDPYYLFPDGRKKREALSQKIKEFYKDKRDVLKANPSLFEEQRRRDEEELRKIDAEIRRQEQELDELSLYDTEELSLCIFEAWMEQRAYWYRGEVLLENGSIVSTYPAHYIRLDAQGLRLRLDGGKMAGDNWRKKLIGDKLKTLSRFERSAVDKRGREVDSGDRFLKHVIDGLSEIKEGDGGDHLVIHKRLQEAGGIPSQSFYVDVSLQFMTNYFYIHEPQKGVMLLNNEAAGEALSRAKDKKLPESERKKAKKEAEGHREEIRKKPYSTRTNRALSVSNLEKWSKENKAFYGVLEDEKTTKKKQKIKREGVPLVPCKGSYGKGYKVKTWVDKVAPGESRPGPRGGVAAFKTLLECLSFFMNHKDIGLQVELSLSRGKNKTAETYWNEKSLSMLGTYKDAPQKVYDFKLTPYLPEDLEERLRRRLNESDIEAMDEGEDVGGIMTASTPGGLRPIDIRAARIKAGWSQATLAEKVGVSRPLIAYWESGNKPVPLKREAALREILKDYMEPQDRPSV